MQEVEIQIVESATLTDIERAQLAKIFSQKLGLSPAEALIMEKTITAVEILSYDELPELELFRLRRLTQLPFLLPVVSDSGSPFYANEPTRFIKQEQLAQKEKPFGNAENKSIPYYDLRVNIAINKEIKISHFLVIKNHLVKSPVPVAIPPYATNLIPGFMLAKSVILPYHIIPTELTVKNALELLPGFIELQASAKSSFGYHLSLETLNTTKKSSEKKASLNLYSVLRKLQKESQSSTVKSAKAYQWFKALSIKPGILDALKELSALKFANFDSPYISSALLAFSAEKSNAVWYSIFTGKSINAFLKKREIYLQSQKKLLDKQMKKKQSNYEEAIIRSIFVKIYGADEFMRLYKKIPISIIHESKILNYATKEQALRCNKELETYKKINVALKQKQKWAETAKSLYTETSIAAKIELFLKLCTEADIPRMSNQIKSMITAGELPENTDLAMINIQSVPLLCPHVRDTIELEIAKASQETIKNWIISGFGEVQTSGTFCKVCGEMLEEMDNQISIAGLVEGYNTQNPELKEFIWKTASYVVRGSLEFKKLVGDKEINAFISGIVDRLEYFIEFLDKNLRRIKTLGEKELINKRKIYTWMYVIVLLVKFINENQEVVYFKPSDALRIREFGRTDISSLMAVAIEKTVYSQNIIIRELGLTRDFIAEEMKRIHAKISSRYTGTSISTKPQVGLLDYILQDPLYVFLAQLYRISAFKSCDIKSAKRENDLSYLPKNILGSSLAEIEEQKINPYANAKIPEEFTADLQEAFKKTMSSSEVLKSLPGFIRNGINKALIGSIAKYRLEYSNSNVANISYTVNTDEAIRINPLQLEFENRNAAAIETERLALSVLKYYRQKRGGSICKSRNLFFNHQKENDRNIHFIFGAEPEHHRHKFSLFRFFKPGKTGEVMELGKLASHPDVKQLWADAICSICKKSKSELLKQIKQGDKSVDETVKSCDENSEMGNFYTFFISNCPENKTGSFHLMKDGKCGLCGFSQKLIGTMEFYKKYKNKLQELRGKGSKKLDVKKFTKKEQKAELPEFNFVEFAARAYEIYKTTNKISNSEFSNFLQTIGIGAREDHEAVLKSGKNAITSESERYMERKIMLHQYIQNILIFISGILNYKNMAHPTQEMKQLMEKAVAKDIEILSKLKISDILGKILPNQTYYSWYAKSNSSPDKEASELLHRLLLLILREIMNIQTEYKKNILAFLIDYIFKHEKLLGSLSDRAVAQISAKISFDINYPGADASDQYTDYDDLVNEDATNPFGYSEVDYNGENAEPN